MFAEHGKIMIVIFDVGDCQIYYNYKEYCNLKKVMLRLVSCC